VTIEAKIMDAVQLAARRMALAVSENIYRDMDPWNTEWQQAVRVAMRYRRKKARKFFQLWLDELEENRLDRIDLDGLRQVYPSSTTKYSV